MKNLLELYTTKKLFVQGLPMKVIKNFQNYIEKNDVDSLYDGINDYLNTTEYTFSTKKYYRNRLRRSIELVGEQ